MEMSLDQSEVEFLPRSSCALTSNESCGYHHHTACAMLQKETQISSENNINNHIGVKYFMSFKVSNIGVC